MTDNQTEFADWARVEVMGHQTHIGYVTTQVFGGAVLFRVDRPELPEEELTLEKPGYFDGRVYPAGTKITNGKIEKVSVLIGAGSIYRIIPCTEAVALKAIRESESRPLLRVELPAGLAIAAPPEEESVFDEEETA